jgi:hypothetical protein
LGSALHPSPIEIATEAIHSGQGKEVHPMAQLRRLATQVLVVAVPVLLVIVETAGGRIP